VKLDAIIFSDAHVSAADGEGADRLLRFLADVAPAAAAVYILGDLFDFWYGPKQARTRPYSDVLSAIKTLSAGGVAVTFYHGNRDFYVDDRLAREYAFRLVRDWSVETVAGRRVLLCHGDMLCTNDVRYHRMKAVLRSPVTRAVVTRLPARAGHFLARLSRGASRREVAAKPQWVLGIDDAAVIEAFSSSGAQTIVCGHTHREERREFPAPQAPRTLYTLGDFGTQGYYLECTPAGFACRRFRP
jgi:UDP-2,3-diacylglucosamine hydrolase